MHFSTLACCTSTQYCNAHITISNATRFVYLNSQTKIGEKRLINNLFNSITRIVIKLVHLHWYTKYNYESLIRNSKCWSIQLYIEWIVLKNQKFTGSSALKSKKSSPVHSGKNMYSRLEFQIHLYTRRKMGSLTARKQTSLTNTSQPFEDTVVASSASDTNWSNRWDHHSGSFYLWLESRNCSTSRNSWHQTPFHSSCPTSISFVILWHRASAYSAVLRVDWSPRRAQDLYLRSEKWRNILMKMLLLCQTRVWNLNNSSFCLARKMFSLFMLGLICLSENLRTVPDCTEYKLFGIISPTIPSEVAKLVYTSVILP